MKILHPIARGAFVTIALLAFTACGGDANEEGAATVDTGGAATASGDVSPPTTVTAQEAVAFMSAANESEVQAARVAARKATNPEVRQFAQKMQREHSRSAEEISQLAKAMNITLDTSGGRGAMLENLHQMSQQMSQQLDSTPRGPEFDRAYIDGQVHAHQLVLENLQRIAASAGTTGTGTPAAASTAAGATSAATRSQPSGIAARDTTLGPTTPQQAAQKMIPHVQRHLNEARQIQSRLTTAAR